MSDADRVGYLKVALVVVGAIFIVGIYPLTILWPAGWVWNPAGVEYLQMVLGVYATLGVFLIMASRNPLANLSLIWFTVWSSLVHAAIMGWQALTEHQYVGHLWGDVLALVVVAIVLAAFTPRRATLAGQ
jgi:hypothetical protein